MFALLGIERFAYTVTKVLLDPGETGQIPDCMTLGPDHPFWAVLGASVPDQARGGQVVALVPVKS